MHLLYCSNCKDVFSLSAVKKKCVCKSSVGQLVDGTSFYTGEFAIALLIPDHFFTERTYADSSAVTKKSQVKVVNTEERDFCIRVIEYLNEKAGTAFRAIHPSSASSLILQRKKELDCQIEDFFGVIDKKVNDWRGTEWEQYLRPETLFNKKKFEGYLGQSNNGAKKSHTTFSKFRSTVQAAAGHLHPGSNTDQNT